MIDDLENLRVELDESAFEESLIADVEAELAAPAQARDDTEGPGPGDQPAWIGKVLGHFKLLRLIGQGAMGFVVQAKDVNLKRIVALKILRKRIEGLPEEKGVRQFLREARAAARIEHPNVIQVYEISQHEGWWYIAMEWLEGQDLKRVVRSAGPLPIARACPIVADAATALSVAHESGIIHRDVKPSNLMLTRTGRCKLTDFGFARVHDPADPQDFTEHSVGTPQFMAPEIVEGRPPTPAVDVYSLGATLHYALLGRAPYAGRSISEICQKHVSAPPPDVCRHLAACPVSLSVLLQRAMAKDPADRPAAAEMAAALHAEAVSFRSDDSAASLAAGSGVVGHAAGGAEGSTIEIMPAGLGGQPVAARAGWRGWWTPRRWLLMLVCLIAAALGIGAGWRLVRDRLARPGGAAPGGSGSLAKRFPGAPETYGVLPAGELCQRPAAKPPPFSWVGQADATGLRFAASRRGRHYYKIDDPAAVLIRAEDFVGYATAGQARADGKTPAP